MGDDYDRKINVLNHGHNTKREELLQEHENLLTEKERLFRETLNTFLTSEEEKRYEDIRKNETEKFKMIMEQYEDQKRMIEKYDLEKKRRETLERELLEKKEQ